MTAVVFETPGLIDMRAFTVMGAHAKPRTDAPIGYFGTGLKYALAVLVREGAEPIVWVGFDRFRFSKVSSTFRGAPLDVIKMSRLREGNARETSYEMPFTTAMGKNWKVWMAYRELASNTSDEGGLIYHDTAPADAVRGSEDVTRIVVDLPAFEEAHEKRAEVFLAGGLRSGSGVQVLPGPSKVLWWRGMRVLDLPKPSALAYNLLDPIDLTEDRTLKHEHQARWAIAKWVVSDATADQVEAVLKAKPDTWESILDFPSWAMPPPSAAFKDVLTERRGNARPILAPSELPPGPRISGPISRAAWAFYAPHARADRPRQAPMIEKPWRLTDEHPRPWRVEGLEVLDSVGNAVFAAPEGYYDDWNRTAEAIVARINLIGRVALPERPSIEVVENEEAADPRFAGHGPEIAEDVDAHPF
jgi:hypothetical protein